jgi:hypothetical protein
LVIFYIENKWLIPNNIIDMFSLKTLSLMTSFLAPNEPLERKKMEYVLDPIFIDDGTLVHTKCFMSL